jgi:RNA polymerase sigma-70 factor (ECF subfamily)
MPAVNAPTEFEAFVRRYQDMVFGTAVRLLGNTADAEDMAQTVFLRAFQRYDEVVTSPAAAGWLKTTTRNVCLNHLARYRSRWRFFSELSEEGRAGYAEGIASDVLPIVEQLERADVAAALEQAVRGLPAQQRVPLVLFHFEGASYQEIADLLRISLAKVKSDIHRGRETLRHLLGDHDAIR